MQIKANFKSNERPSLMTHDIHMRWSKTKKKRKMMKKCEEGKCSYQELNNCTDQVDAISCEECIR